MKPVRCTLWVLARGRNFYPVIFFILQGTTHYVQNRSQRLSVLVHKRASQRPQQGCSRHQNRPFLAKAVTHWKSNRAKEFLYLAVLGQVRVQDGSIGLSPALQSCQAPYHACCFPLVLHYSAIICVKRKRRVLCSRAKLRESGRAYVVFAHARIAPSPRHPKVKVSKSPRQGIYFPTSLPSIFSLQHTLKKMYLLSKFTLTRLHPK